MADKRLALFLGSDTQPPDTDTIHANLLLTDMGGGDYAVNVIGGGGGSPVAPVVKGNLTDASGTIAVNATSQQIFAANTNRRYLLIQNNANEDLWINFGGAANIGQPSIRLFAAGAGSIVCEGTFIPTQSVTIIGATAGSAYTAKEG